MLLPRLDSRRQERQATDEGKALMRQYRRTTGMYLKSEVQANHKSRRACATGRLAARMAGGMPPRTPIAKAKTTPMMSKTGVILKAKARWENVCQFMAPVVRPLRGSTARQPTRPPTKEIRRASNKKDVTTLADPKPSARMVAISRPRSETAEYIVFRAPKMAPMAMIAATNPPRMVISVVMRVDCFE